MYRSGFEKDIAAKLEKRGIPFQYEVREIPYTKRQIIKKKTKELHGLAEDFVAYTYHIYTVDFTFESFHVEAKGQWKAADRKKMIEIKKQHPDLDIRMWFQSDNKINPGSKTRYSDVCKKNGITYHVGRTLPPWFGEYK